MTSGIYSITHRDSGKFYIGSTVNSERRWYDHIKLLRRGKHHSRHLQSAWNKYGAAAFVFEMVLECLEHELEAFEQVALDEFKPAYNMSPTAESPRGTKRTPEVCAKIAAARKRQVFTPEHRAAQSRRMMGHAVSKETCEKVSRARLGMKFTPEHCANMAAVRVGKPGRLVPGDERARISKALMGHPVSQSVRDAVRAARLGKKDSDEVRRKKSEAQKRRYATNRSIIAA